MISILAAAIIQGSIYFALSFRLCGYYIHVHVFEGGVYLKKYGKLLKSVSLAIEEIRWYLRWQRPGCIQVVSFLLCVHVCDVRFIISVPSGCRLEPQSTVHTFYVEHSAQNQ